MRSMKQTLVSTSSNHVELIALHEATRECVWLRVVIEYIQSASGLSSINDASTTHEDNVACIDQMKKGYIKKDNIKYIALKFFFSHQQQEHQKIEVKQIRSQDNLAELFSKSLQKSTFQKYVRGIRLRKLSKLSRM